MTISSTYLINRFLLLIGVFIFIPFLITPLAYALAIIGLVVSGIALSFKDDMTDLMRTLIMGVLAVSSLIAAQNILSIVIYGAF